jgi:hypothetical protein
MKNLPFRIDGLEYTCVVDQNIDAAELFLTRLDEGMASGNLRHVRRQDRNTLGGSNFFCGRAKLCFIPAIEEDGPFHVKAFGGFETDA